MRKFFVYCLGLALTVLALPSFAQQPNTCGPEFVTYPIGKSSGITLISFGGQIKGMSQYYDAPDTLLIDAVNFFAYLDSSTNQTVDAVVEIYEENGPPNSIDSLPANMGAPLARDTVSVDSSGTGYPNNIPISEVQYTADFSANPVTINGTGYVVSVTLLDTSYNHRFGVNDFQANDGGQEDLMGAHFLTQGGSYQWVKIFSDLSFDQGQFNADGMIFPRVSYAPSTDIQVSDDTTTVGTPVTFSARPSDIINHRMYNVDVLNGNFQSWHVWNTGDGSGPFADSSITHSYASSGTYTATLTDTVTFWGDLCSTSASQDVVVLGSQNCNYTKNVDSLIGVECKGDGDGKIVVSASGGMGNFTYALDNPNDFVSSGSFANLEAGTYRVFFNDGNCITDTSLTVEAQDSISKPSVLRDGDTLRGPQAPSYQWYRDGSAIQGATSREYVVTQDGDYFLEVISSSGNCNAFSDTTEVIINSIADRQGSDAWLSIRPNPSAGAFTISAEGLTAHQPVRLRMMDVNGRVLRRQIFEPAGTQLSQTLQRKDLPAGIYLLELQQGNRSSTRKLMLR